jgi:hypothetical protein
VMMPAVKSVVTTVDEFDGAYDDDEDDGVF